ncbi:hypothetical protein DUF567 [Gottschalkia acidurici 9a]|uniref:Tubby C 2 family protein n=1 Tax=Gottschalkia acidurici (strain ATCC 7906 / DSM 604 / BCRC 14475 / CIP 104303 / KCTC 5404 / NCIMB 10678 / 9a) TaxID=1128398 RepID=K0B361_GOTA9|nr:LURP-one-related family protein [Gottschalkia acidurici]AFS79325.1 hypothetical protein DUF567 [Gottschalkia acidurici 9a]
MKYIVRQKIFSLGDIFNITDEFGKPIFQVEGKIFSIGNKLNIYDMNEKHLIYIEQKIFKFLPEYNIYIRDIQVARVKKQLTFFKSKFDIESNYGNFEIDGDIFDYNFSIYRNGRPIASVDKKYISFSDTYSVNIAEGEKDEFILALVIVIDQVLHDNNN